MAITPLPPAPGRADTQTVWDGKAFAFTQALPTFVTDLNSIAEDVAANAAASLISELVLGDIAGQLIAVNGAGDGLEGVAPPPVLLATVDMTSGTIIIITDLPDARLLFQLVNVTCDTDNKRLGFRTSNDNGATFPGVSALMSDQGDFRDGVGGAIGFVELFGQARSMASHVSNGAFALTLDLPLMQRADTVLSGHINAVRWAWAGGTSDFAASTAGNPDSGKILIWRLS